MIKNDCIIVIGCSHMFGCEHRSANSDTIPSTDTFIDHIGKKNNVPVYNFSQPGASNQTILRRLLIAIEFTKANKLDPLFVLQWTELERYETLVPASVNASADWPWIRTNAEIKRLSNENQLKKWSEDFYRLYDSKTLLFESLKSVQHANLLLTDLKQPVINCLAGGWDIENHNIEPHAGFVSSDSISDKSVYSETLRKWYNDNNYILNKDLQEKHGVEAYNHADARPYKDGPCKDDIVLSLLWKQVGEYKWWFYNHDYKIGMKDYYKKRCYWKYGLKDYCKDNNLEIGSNGHALESAHASVSRYMLKADQFLNTLTQ